MPLGPPISLYPAFKGEGARGRAAACVNLPRRSRILVGVDDVADILALRTRKLGRIAPNPQGPYVLYWMRTAVRAWENPALDAAVALGNQLGLPVFVYHAVSERYRYASDRHHTFILEGARDVARQLAHRGIATAFHCERPGHRGRHLEALGRRAAAVISEEMPVSPLRNWTRALADRLAAQGVPVWTVDTACIVPMRFVGKGVDRAFAYRRRVSPVLERFIHAERDITAQVPPVEIDLPFTPVDWQATEIRDLVATCDIDHTVGPVPHTSGGSTAGYARWRRFMERKLERYDKDRNDPNRYGVSRMSAYLHYGMVAPTRLAREALAVGGAGPQKYVDELLVWRELPYTWCLYQREHESVDVLPPWALTTLEDRAKDPRPEFSDEALERGATGVALWDLAQKSLRIHGELHNNVRMTWGKALVEWSRSPEEALRRLVDLNHRFALDGRDPASYGGLLWCLGLFDRPFPESPIFGRVRSRSVAAHAKRLDVVRYARHVTRSLVDNPPRVAVIGGGVAGAMCARTLADHGVDVHVFDKGRGAGGRMSTRRREVLRFDHGAQYFTVRDRHLRRRVALWEQAGVVQPWDGAFGRIGPQGEFIRDHRDRTRYVGAPSMNALVRHLLTDLESAGRVRWETRIGGIAREQGGWRLSDEAGVSLGQRTFDRVVLAVPAPQAVVLLGEHAFAAKLSEVEVAPCWAMMSEVSGVTELPWVGVRPERGPIAWIGRDHTKPGRRRGAFETWVLHATPDWSRQHLEDTPQQVADALVAALKAMSGLGRVLVHHPTAHRWRYALVTKPLGEACLYDSSCGLGVCGDGLVGGRVESALVSAAALAGRLLGALNEVSTTESESATAIV